MFCYCFIEISSIILKSIINTEITHKDKVLILIIFNNTQLNLKIPHKYIMHIYNNCTWLQSKRVYVHIHFLILHKYINIINCVYLNKILISLNSIVRSYMKHLLSISFQVKKIHSN